MTIRRLLTVVALAALLAGCKWCPPPPECPSFAVRCVPPPPLPTDG